MLKKIFFWVIAIALTLGASVYQRMTGPTNPKRESITINGEVYDLKFPRSGGEVDCPILLKGIDNVDATLIWREYPRIGEFKMIPMASTPEGLVANLPKQPHAGKLEYYIRVGSQTLFEEDPLVIRFKGDVPAGILIPHILAMFISMLFSCYTLLLALDNNTLYKRYLRITIIILGIGGFIFGPLVQKHAFDIYWSGFPFGMDLTDNKTLIAFIALLIPMLTIRKSWNRWATVLAVLVLFVTFSIPHSLRGSELNRVSNQIETSNE